MNSKERKQRSNKTGAIEAKFYDPPTITGVCVTSQFKDFLIFDIFTK